MCATSSLSTCLANLAVSGCLSLSSGSTFPGVASITADNTGITCTDTVNKCLFDAGGVTTRLITVSGGSSLNRVTSTFRYISFKNGALNPFSFQGALPSLYFL